MPKRVNPQQLLDQSGSTTTGAQVFTAQCGPSIMPKKACINISATPMDTGELDGRSEILIALAKLDRSRLEYIDGACHQFEQESEERLNTGVLNNEEFENIMRGRLRDVLHLPFDIFDQVTRSRDLAYIVHDYLTHGNQPTKPAQEIIRMMWNPLGRLRPSWLETCCQMLLDDQIFDPYFNCILHGSKLDFQKVIEKNPVILMNEHTDDLLQKRLVENLKFEFLHNKIMQTLNNDKQTIAFTTHTFIPWVMLYTDEHDEEDERDPRFLKLYDLLIIKDNNGNTALHINTYVITQILKFRYATIHNKKLIELIEMEDGNGRKADPDGQTELVVLLDHLNDNRYLLYGKPLVLIIYTTKDRPGGEMEARSIYHAFESTDRFEVKMEKNKSRNEISQIIQDAAHREEYKSVKPSAFIVVLMSHGNVGVVQDFEKKDLGLGRIEATMCSQKLKYRPKILITQACQEIAGKGDRPDNSTLDAGPGGESRTPYGPRNPHFCAIMSSVSGKPSVRNEFIPKIAEQLITLSEAEKGKGTCILKMIGNVSQKMKAAGIAQTPIAQSTLKSEFRL